MKTETVVKLALGVAIVGAVGYSLYLVKKKGGQVAQAVNPFNNDNIINQGFTSLYQAVTGSEGTLGTDVYDVTHDGTLNPASSNNIINRGVNSIGGAITGQQGWSLGSAIYDWTH